MYKVCHFEKQLSIISFSLCLYYLFTFDKWMDWVFLTQLVQFTVNI
jgi:hypothetical protein